MGVNYSKMKGTTQLGTVSECPMCGEQFNKNQTYDSVNKLLSLSIGEQTYRQLYAGSRVSRRKKKVKIIRK